MDKGRHFAVWGPPYLISVAMICYHFPSPGAQESNLGSPTGQIPPALGKNHLILEIGHIPKSVRIARIAISVGGFVKQSAF